MENQFFVDSEYLSPEALSRKHQLETDPASRTDHMAYLPGMERIQSDVMDKVMAQMGAFVPARSAHVGIVDRVFTRVGASDDLAAGQSTFMVEMTEVAELLRNRQEPADPGRDRPGHQHLRRHVHRPRGAGILRRQTPPGVQDPLCHPLP